MHATIEVAAALLAAAVGLAALAARLRLPLPVVLVAGGLSLGFIPGVPHVRLDPDLVLFAFLPPLIYSAAFLAPNRELSDHAGQVALLAVGLVLVTLVAVAALAHWVVGLPWATAFVLGAILGPTDPVTATTIARRLGAPGRITYLLEGEALINDGTALAAYKIAVAAAVSGTFAIGPASLRLAWVGVGGVLVGLVVAWLVVRMRRWIHESPLEVGVSLLTPFLAYLPAERVGGSGVLAAVAAGLYVSWHASGSVTAATRLQSLAFWQVTAFTLEATLFLLLGLQFPEIVGRMEGPAVELIAQAAAVVVVIVLVRYAWMFVVARRGGIPPRELTVLGWSGMRGAVSLAAALAVPLDLAGRDLVLFLTVTTVVATVIVPALTLPGLLRRLGLEVAEERRRADLDARIRLTHAALERLEEFAHEGEQPPPDEVMGRLRGVYEARLDRLEALRDEPEDLGDERRLTRPLRRELVAAERRALTELRERREVPPEVAREIVEDLDLEETRLAKD